MLLNARSRSTNYHAAMNALVFWDQGVSKRLMQAFNHFSLSASHSFQLDAVQSLSRNAVQVARQAAADPRNLVSLPYDNFNWKSRAWETSGSHGTVQHDQVSAMLVVLHIPENLSGIDARHLADIRRFDVRLGERLKLPAEESLNDIIPTPADYSTFRSHAIHHVAAILAHDLPQCDRFVNDIPAISDPTAITPHRTERYYLPTFDQEQSSTRGNMVVLEHYFLKVLAMPKEVFEQIKAFVLGDRLTTARDRAAQDQRTVDRSPFRFDHLSCLEMLGGIMHYCLNMIQNFGRVYWGKANASDALSLQAICAHLPNRSEINTRKYDFYAWLRFLNVILRSLVVTAATAVLNCDTIKDASDQTQFWEYTHFEKLCEKVVDQFLHASLDGLEDTGVKPKKGSTLSGHGALLFHDIMTLHEMRDAIKHGHPERMLRMLKFWAPMYYAGGGYNYSHETMELLHNIKHDWPQDTAQVLLAGMLVNTTGRPDGFKEGDLDVEHLNNAIKSRAHGVNASPQMLENVTPAIGEVQYLVRQMFDDLDVEDIYQQHSHVKQDEDVRRLTAYMLKHKIFRWDQDRESTHDVPQLLTTGLYRLSGVNGGHMKHLMRHKLRLRTRLEGQQIVPVSESDARLAEEADEELRGAFDGAVMGNHTTYTTIVPDPADDELASFDNEP